VLVWSFKRLMERVDGNNGTLLLYERRTRTIRTLLATILLPETQFGP
jgi:hypothetical protein